MLRNLKILLHVTKPKYSSHSLSIKHSRDPKTRILYQCTNICSRQTLKLFSWKYIIYRNQILIIYRFRSALTCEIGIIIIKSLYTDWSSNISSDQCGGCNAKFPEPGLLEGSYSGVFRTKWMNELEEKIYFLLFKNINNLVRTLTIIFELCVYLNKYYNLAIILEYF